MFQFYRTIFHIFFQRVQIFVSNQSHVDLLLTAYRTAQGLLSINEDGVLVMHRVMDICRQCARISQQC